MKVRELIADSVFTAGAGRASAIPPRVTVILPTFRRGDSGLLQRAIDSLLEQSFTDFELLIVDDASTDSTAEVIADAMRRDPRVSMIRHPRNLGLPAISEYEAYVRARGDLISFAFDDTVFYRDALRHLVRESGRHPDTLIVGYVTFFVGGGDDAPQTGLLGKDAHVTDLVSRNVIPNSAVLAPKSVLDVVGLYDPHVSLARLCDYDLWLRVRERFPIRFVDICVGEEHGPATSDSLGATYPLDAWASDDRMRQNRDSRLRPDAFPDLDVFETASFDSRRTRTVVDRLTAQHLGIRSWMTAPPSPDLPGRRVPRVILLAEPTEATPAADLDALRAMEGLQVRLVDPRFRGVSELAAADALIVSSERSPHVEWVEAARMLGIPVGFSEDDSFVTALHTRVADDDSDEPRRLAQLADWLGHQLTLSRSAALSMPSRRARRNLPPTRPATALTPPWRGRRGARRFSVLRRATSRSSHTDRRTLGYSVPLTDVPYVSFPVTLVPGRYVSVQVTVWGAGLPGDLVGIELVDPESRIRLHRLAALPRDGVTAEVTFDARTLIVETTASYELRVFVRSPRPAFLIGPVDRGLLGIGPPRVLPLATFRRD